MHCFQIWIILAVILHSNLGLSDRECLGYEQYFAKHLATKTPYREVANKNDSAVFFEGCHPIRIWMLIRHGTRNPGEKMILKIKTTLISLRTAILSNHNQTRGSLCDTDLAKLALWYPQIEIADQKRLVHEGEDEMVDLAERIQHRFPDLIPDDYSNSSFKFRFTATQRTKESQRHFAIGLFGRKVARYVWSPEPLGKDPILRFYKLCTKWIKEVDKNPDSLLERKKFEQSNHMKMALETISQRLGFSTILSVEDVHLMYMTCAFESAWSPRTPSPWCSIFSESELEALEYAQDLEYFWIDGYGNKINYEQACPLVSDMLQHLTSEEDPPSVFYFTHSGTLLKTLAHLGLYKDEVPLTHKTFNLSRQWRLSYIDAFGTNLASVLFRCADGLKVLTLHQERPVHLPGCPQDAELCPLEKILRSHRGSLYDCRFSEMCQL